MGVPKFYRWISERYPTLSEVVRDYQIPEFDNMYLDMNGIIHTCSHPNDSDPHFRISQEQIFRDIFHYIEVLFSMIRPQKVFFMAVDGVAPRAKMNQQRGRRFRSAREAEESENKARIKGEVLPTEERFDSNCITPGTEFMDKLDKQLQYFVTEKISKDTAWQNCTVIYSGHQTPGEGEHKIMEYIRYSRSQPGYDPNIRHCLYGLDADLMMLGLTSHDPHFSLLREEVKFGRKEASKRTTTAEETTFHLLHLSLMRDYINYEFFDLKDKLPFEYNLENIIDDWVLMGFLVGNDFIPHLPLLHINKDALPTLFNTYKAVMPTLDGYLNEGGKLNLVRFEKFMEKLSEFDSESFSEMNADLKYFQAKCSTTDKQVKSELDFHPFFEDGEADAEECEPLESASQTLARLNITGQPFLSDGEESDETDEDPIEEEFRQHRRNYYVEKMGYHDTDRLEDIRKEQALNYVRGIQWILHYYYDGICSWAWFYPYHYAPFISDIKNFSHVEIKFEIGKPFMPFEQLLAVLPPLSVKLLPKCYAPLMLNVDSPVIDFYPRTFDTDLNGKQQDWEAVVLIPFIDEQRLLEAMEPLSSRLSADEKRRTAHGPMFFYTYTPQDLGPYPSPGYFPNISMNHALMKTVYRSEWEIPREKIHKGLCEGVMLETYFQGFPTLKHLEHTFYKKSSCVKVFQQPSRGESIILKVPDIYVEIEKDKVLLQDLANNLMNSIVYVGWPHLKEAKVVGISNGKYRMSLLPGTDDKNGGGTPGHMIDIEAMPDESGGGRKGNEKARFDHEMRSIQNELLNRFGIDAKESSVILYCKNLTGRKYTFADDGTMKLSRDWSHVVTPYLAQTIVRNLTVYDPGYVEKCSLVEHFPPGCKVFMLGNPNYGSFCTVIENSDKPEKAQMAKGRVRVQAERYPEPDLSSLKINEAGSNSFMTTYLLAQRVGLHSSAVSRITGTLFLVPPEDSKMYMDTLESKNKINIGLGLRYFKKNEEICGLSQRDVTTNTWLYSEQCLQMIREYGELFPEVFRGIQEHTFTNTQTSGGRYQQPNNFIPQGDIFRGPDAADRVSALKAWLKKSEPRRNERQRCGTERLNSETIGKIALYVKKTTLAERSQPMKMLVKPHLLYKPNPLQGSSPIDGPIKTELWDRIINVRDGYSVPLGARGTIVGIQPSKEPSDVIYDILFDKAFAGGLNFDGGESCEQCCYRLYWSSFINISAKSRPANENKDEQAYGYRDQREQWREGGYEKAWSAAQPGQQGGERRDSPRQYNNTGMINYGPNCSAARGSYSNARGRGNNHRGGGGQMNINYGNNAYAGAYNHHQASRNTTQQYYGREQSSDKNYSMDNSRKVKVQSNNSEISQPQKTYQPVQILQKQTQSPAATILRTGHDTSSAKPQMIHNTRIRNNLEDARKPHLPNQTPLPLAPQQKPRLLNFKSSAQAHPFLESIYQQDALHDYMQKQKMQHHHSPVCILQRKNSNGASEDIKPPDPCDLPSPGFLSVAKSGSVNTLNAKKILPTPAHQKNDQKEEALSFTPKVRVDPESGVPMSVGGIREILSPSDVECIVHGTFYNQWSVAQCNGLNKGKGNHIPCLGYDPLANADQKRKRTHEYHFLIYLDVAACLAAGVKFLLMPAGQVLCSGDANGRVQAHLFEKVYDARKKEIIFPKAESYTSSADPEKQWGNSSMQPFVPTQVIKKVTPNSKAPSASVDITQKAKNETMSDSRDSGDETAESCAPAGKVTSVTYRRLPKQKKQFRRLGCNFKK